MMAMLSAMDPTVSLALACRQPDLTQIMAPICRPSGCKISIQLTFMSSWHAGVLQRVSLGPVSGRSSGSRVQQHPSASVRVTELAARLPLIHAAQGIKK
jgi:hypothetical protein